MLTLLKIARQLATVASVDDAKEIRDKAEAIRVYSAQQRDCKEIERQAVVIRLRAERRIGELLAASVKRGSKCTPGEQLPAGITRKQSSSWQLAAKLPAPKFERYLEGRELSTKGVVKLAAAHKRERAAASGPATGFNVYTGDMGTLHERLDDGSVDLFLTDPPYADVAAYGRLAELAATKLRAGGLCLAYAGVYHLPELMRDMGEHLDYFWMFARGWQGTRSSVPSRHIYNSWRPILAFSKGKPNNGYVIDFIQGQPEKSLHPWQQPQSEAEYLIEKLTKPGELVVDPYCGSGTTLAAAKALGRSFVGCEVNATTARGARKRVAA